MEICHVRPTMTLHVEWEGILTQLEDALRRERVEVPAMPEMDNTEKGSG
jgi:hypothetical protein